MKLRCDTMKYLYLHKKLIVESVADVIPQIKGAAVLRKNFPALWASVWFKSKGARAPGPLPWIRHCESM